MGDFWKDKVVLVTGGSGFLGRTLVAELERKGCKRVIVTPRSKDCDLARESDVQKLFKTFARIDIVIHLAAVGGGIGFVSENPGEIYYKNILMNTLVMEYARKARVKKFVGIGTMAAYPQDVPVPLREDDLWKGRPEATIAPYAWPKKMMIVQGEAYGVQYGFNAIHLLVTNLYGPGDHFDSERGHVVAALIKRFVDASVHGRGQVVIWGDGSATRDFLYVDDAAQGILMATEHYKGHEPVNLGSGVETTIRDLATLIAKLTGFQGEIIWDATKPSGQPRRVADICKAEQLFGFRPKVNLEEGLCKTINWYKNRLSGGNTVEETRRPLDS